MPNSQLTPSLPSTITPTGPGREFRRGLGLVLLVGVLLLAGVLTPTLLSFRGMCFADMRFRSDAEDNGAAIDQVLALRTQALRLSVPGKVEFKSVKIIPYANRGDFEGANPECCKIVPHNTGDLGPYTSLSQRLFGYAAKIVSLQYTVNYVGDDGRPKQEIVTTQYAVTNCGRAWNATH